MDRNDLEQKLTKQGYIHPETENNPFSPYQAYSATGDPYKSQKSSAYASFEENPNEQKSTSARNVCQKCKEVNQQERKALYECDCEINDFMCEKGHIWYYIKDVLHFGNPHDGNEKVLDNSDDEEDVLGNPRD